jgi:hypothetical protein
MRQTSQSDRIRVVLASFFALMLCVSVSLKASGQLTVLGSAGSIRFGVQPLGGPVAGGGHYNSFDFPIAGRFPGEMIDPGFGYPDMSAAPGVVSGFAGPLGPPGALFGVQPRVGAFGGGHTVLAARAGGRRGGIFWPSFSIRDFAPAGGTASTNVSNGVALLGNGRRGFAARAGAFLGVRGFIRKPVGPGGAIGYVAASLVGRIGIYDAAGALLQTIDPAIFIRSDGPGLRPDLTNSSVFVDGVLNPPGTAAFNVLFPPGGVSFIAWGVISVPVVVPRNGFVLLDGTLSLAADPDVTLEVFTVPFHELPEDVPMPDIGFAAYVPEPSGAAMLLIGSGLIGWIVLRRRR